MADVKPGILNLLIVTLMVLVGQTLLRFLVTKYPNAWPGFTSLVMAS
jgi:hypothetical protein